MSDEIERIRAAAARCRRPEPGTSEYHRVTLLARIDELEKTRAKLEVEVTCAGRQREEEARALAEWDSEREARAWLNNGALSKPGEVASWVSRPSAVAFAGRAYRAGQESVMPGAWSLIEAERDAAVARAERAEANAGEWQRKADDHRRQRDEARERQRTTEARSLRTDLAALAERWREEPHDELGTVVHDCADELRALLDGETT